MIDQAVIAVCGCATVYLSQSRRHDTQRWACIFGVVAQPFWLWSTWHAGQWGMFALSLVYTAGWLRGIHNFWLRGR